MKQVVLFFFLLNVVFKGFTQCPFSVSLAGNSTCAGATLTLYSSAQADSIVWYQGNDIVKTATANAGASTGITVAGGNGIGSYDNQLNFPQDVFVDAQGNVYVTDENNSRIQKWAPGATSGITVAGGNSFGPAANQLNGPQGLWVDAIGNIYVADYGNYRVQKWLPGAATGITVAGGNGVGASGNQFNFPVGLFLDAAGNIYVADNNNNRIQKWVPGASSGITVAGGNGPGSAANQLFSPMDVFVDNAGNIYIADGNNYRVQKWPPGASSGITVAGGNGQGNNPNQFGFGYSVYVDAQGNVYVCDSDNNRVQKWVPGATTGIIVAGGNGIGSAANQLRFPRYIFVDTVGNLFVSDEVNARIQKWVLPSGIDSTFQPTSPGTYTAVVTSSSGCKVTTSPFIIYPTVTPSVSIISTIVKACAGTPITFIATPVNGGSSPFYQWQVNGKNAGSNAAVYTVDTLSTGASVSCILSSSAPCTTVANDTSNIIEIFLNTAVNPSVSITASDSIICAGTSVTFTATAVNAGLSTSYQWQVNGTNRGTDSDVFISSSLTNGDIIVCKITSTTCTNVVTAASNDISISVKADSPNVSIAAAKSTVCKGDKTDFLATASNAGNAAVFKWFLNNQLQPGSGPVFSSNQFQNGDGVSCTVSNIAGCPDAFSNTVILAVNDTPHISASILYLNAGQNIALNPGITGDISGYLWSPAATLSSEIAKNPIATPVKSTTYHLTATTTGGCTAGQDFVVKLLRNFITPNAFSPNKDGLNDFFYVLGELPGYYIKDFSIFNRWGKLIFKKANVPANEPSGGWDGNYQGQPQAAGCYVYVITLAIQDRSSQILKGTVELIR